MKKIFALILALILVIAVFGGCVKSKSEKLSVYFKSNTENTINEEKRIYSGKDSVKEKAKFAVAQFIAGPQNENNEKLISKNTKIINLAIKNNIATVNLSDEYSKVNGTKSILLRLALVNTLCSIDGIDGIVIQVNGKSIVSDTSGKEFGVIRFKDVAYETGGGYAEKRTITLYFPDKNGEKLLSEKRVIEVENALSLEKAIVGELLKGPKSGDCERAVPTETKLIGIETKDNVCFVNFSNEFVSKTPTGSLATTLTLYSVVNSLCELDNVSSVQILINGENGVEFGNFVLDIPYEPDDSLLG